MKKALALVLVLALSFSLFAGLVSAEEETVTTYEEYVAADVETKVTVETYVQAKESWWNDKASIHTQAPEGAYYLYEMPCTQEEYDLLVPGTKIRVTGFKGEWAGEVEITDIEKFEILEAEPFVAEPVDVTALWGDAEALNAYINQLVCFKGLTVAAKDENGTACFYGWDNSGTREDADPYFDVTLNDVTTTFTVRRYLTDNTTDVFKAAEELKVGDVIDVVGFLYWYEGPQPHVTAITAAAEAAE